AGAGVSSSGRELLANSTSSRGACRSCGSSVCARRTSRTGVVDSGGVICEVVSTSGVTGVSSLVDGATLAAVGAATVVAEVTVVVTLVPGVSVAVGDGADAG